MPVYKMFKNLIGYEEDHKRYAVSPAKYIEGAYSCRTEIFKINVVVERMVKLRCEMFCVCFVEVVNGASIAPFIVLK